MIGVQVVIIICNIDSFSNLCIDTKLSFEKDAMKKAIAVLKISEDGAVIECNDDILDTWVPSLVNFLCLLWMAWQQRNVSHF